MQATEQECVSRWGGLGHQAGGELVMQVKHLCVITREDLVSPERGGPDMVEPQRRAQNNDEAKSKEFKRNLSLERRNTRSRVKYTSRLAHRTLQKLSGMTGGGINLSCCASTLSGFRTFINVTGFRYLQA
jgi:hypothetical protein